MSDKEITAIYKRGQVGQLHGHLLLKFASQHAVNDRSCAQLWGR